MKKTFLISLFTISLATTVVNAQEAAPAKPQQQSTATQAMAQVGSARYQLIKSFESYAQQGRMDKAVDQGVKATVMYYKENLYKEAFDLLRRIDQQITASSEAPSRKSALYYKTTKERMQMYVRMQKAVSAKEQLNAMERHAQVAGIDSVNNDLLYTKAVYYYTFGQIAQGNAVFKEMATKLTASKDYDKVEEAYQTLIASGRRSNNASMVAQSYKSYFAWKDSVNALKAADETRALRKQIADNEAVIADQDSSLTARKVFIVGLCILAAALAGALVVGGIVLLRYILLSRKQKRAIKLANENNALKAQFIGNISAQLEPTLKKLDASKPEVKALIDFSNHIQTLSELERSTDGDLEMEEVQIPPFCEGLMDEIRKSVKSEVTLTVNAPKMTVPLHREYVAHILSHLLHNAAVYTPEGGHITLDFKKRGAHTHQFLVTDTGCGIPAEQRDEVFKPFREIRDLTTGDGLGLPICRQMALKMKGDLDIDPQFVKGTRFVLELHA